MSVLGDVAIREAIDRREIIIHPMAPWAIGSNSVDLHLAPDLAVYTSSSLSTREDTPVRRFRIHSTDGFLLMPGELYLGSTVEHTSSGPYLPMLDGTSGAGRLGLAAHVTAGVGDVGFVGHWTLEITVIKPTLVYGGEPIVQILFEEVRGRVESPYNRKGSANYAGQSHLPMPSRISHKRRWVGEL